MLKRLKEQGITILVSTPYMDEASLCDRVALIQSGSIMSVNTPQGIIDEFKQPILAVKANDMLHLLNDLKKWEGQEDAYAFGEFHHVVMNDKGGEAALKQYLADKSHQALEIKAIRPDIEDCFMALMKNPVS
jgi:ABC-type multidrug transport system ATPase subunit